MITRCPILSLIPLYLVFIYTKTRCIGFVYCLFEEESGAYCRLSAISLAREKRDGGYIKVVIVVVIGGVDNVENSKKSDGV